MTAHSKIGASSMHRWAACPGSIRLSKGIAGTTSAYAAQGTVAHDFAFLIESNNLPTDYYLGSKRPADGHEFECDEEMVDALTVWVEAGKVYEPAEGDQRFLEHSFDLSAVYPGCFGTCDRVIWKPKSRTLYVDDFKYGAGKLVEVTGNPQLRYYGLGALVTLKLPVEKIVLRIVQPRCPHPDGPVRSETIDAMDMFDFRVDLVEYAQATEKADAKLVAGDHCGFCPAAAVCPEIRRKANEAAAMAFSDAAPFDVAKLADALAFAPIVEAWATSVREFAYAQAEAGVTIPGYKLVDKVARRQWRDVAAAEQDLKLAGLGETEMYPLPELRSPAQIEKHMGKKAFKDIEEKHVHKVSSGHTLAPDSDKRPPAKQSAAEAFAGA